METAGQKLAFGVIGTGRIAHRFGDMVRKTGMVDLVSVYNPHIESAKCFAEEFQIEYAVDELTDFLKKVDAVYIAAPHQTHGEYIRKMLEDGKHVLCEKPMSFSTKEAEELYALAYKNQCVLREAMKTAYCPGFLAMMQKAKNGEIGEIRDVEACFSRLTATNLREYTDRAWGGSFTEFGSYVLLPVLKLLGTEYRDISFQSIYAENGVDSYTRLCLAYENGMAEVKTGLGVKTEGQLVISGTKGYILCESPWWLTRKFEVRYEDPNRREVYEYKYEDSGLQYELGYFVREIRREQIDESVGLSAKESAAAAGILEAFLEENKVKRTEKRKNADTVKIWAHRGCSMRYPENTLEAFRAAAELEGLAGIELDVQFTRDKQVVVFHDENVSRVTNGTKSVQEYTLSELKTLEIRSVDHTVASVPTLEETFKLLKPYCEKNGLLINIEFKTSIIRYEGIEQATLALVRKYEMEKYIVYSSFLPESVALIKKLDPKAKTGMLAGALEDSIRYARNTQADALHPGNVGLNCMIPEDMKGKAVRVWNMEEPFFEDGRILKEKQMTKYAELGATDIITNVPELYLR
jgi:predicted dehydrogenase